MLPRLVHAPIQFATTPAAASASITPAAKVYVTGSAACKKGSLVHSTASATVCGNESAFHAHCTTAKNNAMGMLNCPDGYVAQGTGSCTNDGKC